METHSGLYLFDDDNSTRLNTAKAEVITTMPDEVLANIEQVDENVGDDTEFIRIKTKKHMTTGKSRTTRGRAKHKRLQPGENTLSQGAGKKQVLRSLGGETTKAGNTIVKTKRKQTRSSIQDPVCNFPRNINYRTVLPFTPEAKPKVPLNFSSP